MRLEDLGLEGLKGKAVVSVPEAGAALGLNRDAAYSAAREGRIPTLRVGARHVVVPVAALLRLLQVDTEEEATGETQLRSIGGAR